nr:CamS family sex pheromone protein [Metabacillus lacus]
MVLAGSVLLSACTPNFGDQDEVIQTEENSAEQAIIPKYNISDDYYKMILPFAPGQARGLVAKNLNTRLDIDEFETGLMRIAKDIFPPENDQYLYQEGQYIDRSTISSWLSRKLEGEDLKAAEEKAEQGNSTFQNAGLNPPALTEGTAKERNEQSPIYLAHILEHNYLVKKNENTVELGGVVIGLALNSTHYYRQEDDYARQVDISPEKLREEGEKMAAEVVKRARSMDGLENIPIVVALYQTAEKSSIVPGHFIAKAEAKAGSSDLGRWDNIDEEYHFFPSPEATSAYRDDAAKFERFKGDIDEYFPNYTGVIGKAYYRGGQLETLKVDIPMQFYGKAEVIAFTQYVSGKIMEHFPDYISLEVNISSTAGQESLIVRNPGQEKPTVHIYQ